MKKEDKQTGKEIKRQDQETQKTPAWLKEYKPNKEQFPKEILTNKTIYDTIKECVKKTDKEKEQLGYCIILVGDNKFFKSLFRRYSEEKIQFTTKITPFINAKLKYLQKRSKKRSK